MEQADPIVSVEDLVVAMADPSRGLVLVDARRSRDAHLAAHLPGARRVDLDGELAGPAPDPSRGGRHPLPSPEAFARTLARLGVRPASEVVVYDDQGGAISAARLWWMLRSYGHPRVRVLDGGWQAIEEAVRTGVLALESGPVKDAWSGEGEPDHPVRAWSGAVVEAEGVDRVRLDPDWLVLDVRAPERYRGEIETIDPVAGHVAGAVNAPYAENLDAHGRFLDAATLRARHRGLLGARPPDRVVVHCGSGVTACHALLALERAGLSGAHLYVGSWSEWCRRPELAREP